MNNMDFNNVYKKRLTYGVMYLAYGAIPLTHGTMQQPAYGAYGQVTAGSRNQEIKNYTNNLTSALRIDKNFDAITEAVAGITSSAQLLEILKTPDDYGDSPLYVAANSEHGGAFVYTLLNAEISKSDLITLLELTGRFGDSPLHVAAKSEHGGAFIGALLNAGINKGDLIRLLGLRGGRLGDSPLHVAAESEHGSAFMDALFNAGISGGDLMALLQIPDKTSWTPLHYVANSEYVGAFMGALLNTGISENDLITLLKLKNKTSWTPLHYVANSKYMVTFIDALLDAGISGNDLMQLLKIKSIVGQAPLDFIRKNNKEAAIVNLINRKKMQLDDVPDEFRGHSKPKQNINIAHLANDPIGEVPGRMIGLSSSSAQNSAFHLRNLKLYEKLLVFFQKDMLEKILNEANGGDVSIFLNLAQKNLNLATFEGIEKEYIDTIKAIQYRQKLCDAVLKKFWATKATDDVSSELSKAKPEELYKSPNWTTKKLLEKLLEFERSEKTNPANGKPKEKDSERIKREVQGYFQSSTVREKAPKKKELLDSRNGLMCDKFLGKGSFGKVWLFKDTSSGKQYVVKFFNPENRNSPDAQNMWQKFNSDIKKEAYIPNMLKEKTAKDSALNSLAIDQFANAKVITAWNPETGKWESALIEEAVGKEDLTEVIKRSANPSEAVHMGLQVIAGVNALGDKGIVHRDLKPDNIRIDEDGGLSIIDFGMAVSKDYEDGAAGSYFYMAPEVFEACKNGLSIKGNPSQDIYSMGIILTQVLFGQLCQSTQDNELTRLLGLNANNKNYPENFYNKEKTAHDLLKAFEDVNNSLPRPYPKDVLKDMASIIAGCLDRDPSKRPTGAEVYGKWTQVYQKMTDPRINPNAELQQSSNQY